MNVADETGIVAPSERDANLYPVHPASFVYVFKHYYCILESLFDIYASPILRLLLLLRYKGENKI